jgi:hypothetical protein
MASSSASPFTLTHDDDGIVEQIDGLIELDGQAYLVEAK